MRSSFGKYIMDVAIYLRLGPLCDLKSSSNVSLPFAWITGPATDPSSAPKLKVLHLTVSEIDTSQNCVRVSVLTFFPHHLSVLVKKKPDTPHRPKCWPSEFGRYSIPFDCMPICQELILISISRSEFPLHSYTIV